MELTRRDLLKQMTAAVAVSPMLNELGLLKDPRSENQDYIKPNRPISAIVLGAGNRGNVYGRFALAAPTEMKMIGVAEPIALRNERYAAAHQIADDKRFKTWEDVFKVPKFADAVIISTPDYLHYGPAMAALAMGYHVLLEKPISPSMKECLAIQKQAQKYGNIIAVCHVLRYTPYFRKLRDLAQSGTYGKLMSVNHFEGIEARHMAHSYVRGNWHDSKKTNPILLAKSCHDLDIMRWIVGQPATYVSAFGDLSWFKAENAPAGSTPRCTDGCAVEKDCPYSAIKIYHKDRKRIHVLDVSTDPAKQGDEILEKLKTLDYGRCVYQMDNNQPDHYVSNFQFANGVTAAFAMEAFTSFEARKTRLMFSHGEISGDMDEIICHDFRTGTKTSWKASEQPEMKAQASGHGGGDYGLARNFAQAVSQNKPELLTSTIEASIDSHVMGFQAEKSRLTKKMIKI